MLPLALVALTVAARQLAYRVPEREKSGVQAHPTPA
jgi:hypothetical protein